MKIGKRCLALLISTLMVLSVMPVISVSAAIPADYFEDFSTLTGSATYSGTGSVTTFDVNGSNGELWRLWAYGTANTKDTASFENGVVKLTNTRKSGDNTNNGWSARARLTKIGSYTGVVEVAFDLITKITDGAGSKAQNIVQLLNANATPGALLQLMSMEGRDVYLGAYSNDISTNGTLLAAHDAGDEHKIRYIFKIDYDNDEITASVATYDEDGNLNAATTKGEMEFTGTDAVGGLFFDCGNWGTVAWAEGDYIAFDNLSIRQIPAMTLEDDGIDDSLKGISIKDSFNLDFADNIDSTTLGGVKLCEGDANGTEVEATIGAKGDKLNITPKDNLNPETKYTIVVPNTLKGGTGGTFAGYTVSFYTSDGSEFAASYDFDTLTTNATEWDVIKYLESKDLDVTLQVGHTAPNKFFVTSEAEYNANAGNFDDNTGLIITEDGRLKIASEDNIDSLYLTLTPDADKIEDADIVEIEMDLQTPALDKQITDFMNIHSGGDNKLFRMDNRGHYWYLMNGTTIQTYLLQDTNYGSHKLKLVADMNAGDVDVYVDGKIKGTSTTVDAAKGEPFVNFKIQLNSVTNDKFTHVFVDNLKLREVVNPAVANEADYKDATGVSVAEDIVLNFNTPMSATGIDGITLDGNAVPAILSESGYTLTIDADLTKGTEYTLAIPALTALNGRAFTAANYTFTTEYDAPVFNLSCVLKDKDSNVIAENAALPTGAITAEATCEKDGAAANVYLLIGLFDDNNCLLEVGGGSAVMDAGDDKVTVKTASFTNADNKGKTVKVFVWDSLTNCKPLTDEPLVRP